MPAGKGTSKTLPRYDVDLPPSNPELHARHHSTLAAVLQPQYWLDLNPGLHVGDASFISSCKRIKPPKERLNDLKQQLDDAGVAQVEPEELPWQVDLQLLADAIVSLVRHGWPPSMVLVYDEVWALVHQASTVMNKATGGNQCNMDILAWLVDPNRGDVGFSPHRDRQPDDSPATFRPDGSAMYATMWVPLTRATPENSCLYVIPRFADPGYYQGDPEDEDAPDPLTAALPNKEAYQHIRALPADPGAALLFTHRTIHWGSKGRPGYPTPRISISWGCADDAYEPAYFGREHLPCPPLALRLALVGGQMIIYHERFPAPPKQLRLYYEAFTAQAALFDSSYRAKVVREFVDASKEATAAAAAAPAAAAAATNGTGPSAAAKQPLKSGAAVGDAGGSREPQGKVKSKGKRAAQQEEGAGAAQQPDAAAAAAGCSKEKQKKKQKQQGSLDMPQQQDSSSKRSKGRQKAGEATAAAAAGTGDTSSKKSKRCKKDTSSAAANGTAGTWAQAAAAPAAAATAAAAESGDSDDGEQIDWALLAAQAKAHKAKASKASKSSKQAAGAAEAVAAAAAAARGQGAEGEDDVMDDDDDVMDLALEAMLDGGDFHDDYEDD